MASKAVGQRKKKKDEGQGGGMCWTRPFISYKRQSIAMQLNRTADLEFIQIQSSEQNTWMSKQFAFVKDTWVLSSSDIKKQYTVNILSSG